MATHTLQSLHHHSSIRPRVDPRAPTPTSFPATLFLQTNNPVISISSNSISTTPFPSSAATSVSETSTTNTFETLETHLKNQDFRQADEETRRLIIELAGDAAIKRGYVFFSEVQFIPAADLKTIDSLWKQHSNNKFGYSVQKKIWRKCSKDFTKFFIKVGWMKLLDTEVVQYNYKAFPNEFVWEMTDDSPPEGHLPLTNALRGTQLLNYIFIHPAFETGDESDDEGDDFGGSGAGVFTKPLSNTTGFKTDYSF